MSQPEQRGSSLSDFTGQKKLLGFGVFLAWILLLNFLVNMWILCIFTFFLLVLGGWKGFQAILDSNSLIYLDRFIKPERILPSPESEMQLDNEIHSTINKIIRDFVSSWYRTVSSEPEFETEVKNAMYSMALELKRRAEQVERKAFAQKVLGLCGCHLESYLMAKKIQKQNSTSNDNIWEFYKEVCFLHPSLKSPTAELNFARAIVDLLLQVLVPQSHLESRTGRYIVGELITCNVLLPFISKVSDPDWINVALVDLLTKAKNIDIEDDHEKQLEIPCSLPLKIQSEMPSHSAAQTPKNIALSSYDVVDDTPMCSQQKTDENEPKEENSVDVPFNAKIDENVTMDYLRPDPYSSFYSCEDSDLESPMSDFWKSSTESLVIISNDEALSEQSKDYPTPTKHTSIIDSEDELKYMCNSSGECVTPKIIPEISEPTEEDFSNQNTAVVLGRKEDMLESKHNNEGVLCDEDAKSISSYSCKEALLTEQISSSPHELSVVPPLQTSSPTTGLECLASFSFEPLSSPDGPVVIQNLRITGTITAKEHRGIGSHVYTLYTIKYETAVDTDNPGTLQPVAYHTVNRRYSEFLTLQTRLEEKPELRKIIKNIKGPKKLFPDLPFGNMDTEKVEARKSLLESFLKQLCAVPETANSEEVQEFLALNTDARIAFVKKPFFVSRIDKIVLNAIMDSLKIAFPKSEPQSPTEDGAEIETDGKSFTDTKKSKSKLKFSTKIVPILNVADIQPKVLYCFGDETTVFDGLSLAGMEDFMREQELLLNKPCEVGTVAAEPMGLKNNERMEEGNTDNGKQKVPLKELSGKQAATIVDTGLADATLNLLCLLMKDHWSWMCTENIQKTIRIFFAPLIERWLDVHIANLTCTQQWVTYLRILQEAIWPGGSLPVRPKPVHTDEQKEQTKILSLQCLTDLLPDFFQTMLGVEKYQLTWQLILESLQDPTVNRHLVYSVWDLLLEFLVPESLDEDFQKSLINQLPGHVEKSAV
ncbi:sorting nexin-19 [Erpetoichthys calabaricus]|uniref:sorting nexin-19 n=1 Tax=Erpetoichthys calabaricus TaxID=27687 RepID=UPI002234B8D4|nr:sorting nexin-19 [Erpetoichthys calabaricus]